MGASARTALIKAVVALSAADAWDAARLEWAVAGVCVSDEADGVCHCGQTNLLYLYRIENDVNGAVLNPIGSDCIAHFQVEAMSADQLQLRDLLDLETAARGGLVWDTSTFSRSKITVLYEYGAWVPTTYNHGDPYNDYVFMLDMFNTRRSLTTKQVHRRTQLMHAAGGFLRATGSGARPRIRVYNTQGA